MDMITRTFRDKTPMPWLTLSLTSRCFGEQYERVRILETEHTVDSKLKMGETQLENFSPVRSNSPRDLCES